MESDAKILSYDLPPKFMRAAAQRFKEELGANPDLRQAVALPARWDFHKVKVYLTRQQKNALQTALAKMDKRQVREQIKVLKAMEADKIAEAKRHAPGKIVLPDQEKLYQEAYAWAFYCREAVKFANAYLQSLEYQKKI